MTRNLPNRSAGVVGILLISLLCCGCKKKEEQAPPPSPPPAAKPQQKVQKQLSSVQKRISSVQKRVSSAQGKSPFDFAGKKDPFKPYVPPMVQQAAPPKAPVKQQRVRTDLLPIQSYDITKFKVSGIITGLSENQALVIDPAGKGYVVRQGMKIGNNDGVIVRITPTTVEVLERYQDDSGRTSKRTVRLTLPQKK